MTSVEAIAIPLPHIGSVNAWLLPGDPVTLIDTGPRSAEALAALEAGLRIRGLALEDIELVIGTHHHHDHVGLAATIKRRSGARIAVLDRAADYGRRYSEHVAEERRFALELMRAHGIPPELEPPVTTFWDYIDATSESFSTDVRLVDGDAIVAGGRELRVISRPGHSASDTLLVDRRGRTAFVGDHLLATITPNTEIRPTAGPAPSRSRPRVTYLEGLKLTARMPLDCLFTGHGPAVTSAPELVARHLAQHRRRCRRIIRILEQGPASAYAVARQMWSEATIREQPLLVLWEALGHLDLLVASGVGVEGVGDDGGWRYSLGRQNPRAPRQPGGVRLAHAG
jgi:glyoxylase-like metal-dependent hydrolase (beta-lactamase superfamily II)